MSFLDFTGLTHLVSKIKDALATKPDKDSYDIHSPNEQKVGMWVDGKPLYRRTLTMPLPTVSGWTKIHDAIPDSKPVFIQACAIANGSLQNLPIISSTGKRTTFLYVYDYKAAGQPANGFSAICEDTVMYGRPLYVIFYYTKTTDQATRSISIPQAVTYNEVFTTSAATVTA